MLTRLCSSPRVTIFQPLRSYVLLDCSKIRVWRYKTWARHRISRASSWFVLLLSSSASIKQIVSAILLTCMMSTRYPHAVCLSVLNISFLRTQALQWIGQSAGTATFGPSCTWQTARGLKFCSQWVSSLTTGNLRVTHTGNLL